MDNHNDIALAGGYRKSNRIKGRRTLSYTVLFTLLLSSITFLPGCSPRIIEKVVYQRDTTVVHHRDSIIHRDSIYVKEWMKGDTVYIEKYKDRYVYRDRWRDSIRVQADSFAIERVKEVQVEKPLSWGKRAKIGAFWWLVLAVALLGAWTFRKPLGGIITKIGKTIF